MSFVVSDSFAFAVDALSAYLHARFAAIAYGESLYDVRFVAFVSHAVV